MKLLVTTNGRLFRTPEGKYYTAIVYGYDFFKRYLDVFDSVRLVAHVTPVDKALSNWLEVDGPNLEVFPVENPKGKLGYIKNCYKINKALPKAIADCDAANLRIPDELAFQLYRTIRKHSSIPVGIEVTSNSWEFFSPESTKGIMRPFLRRWWDYWQKKLSSESDASCYVTKEAIQKRYAPNPQKYTTYSSDVDIEQYADTPARDYGQVSRKEISILHISGSIVGKAKGHKELIESIALLKDKGYNLRCTLVGEGSLDQDIQDIISHNNLNVILCGRKNAKEIKDLFLSHDLFVFPSYREGLPRVIVEAMASGIMIVATDLDGIKELLPDESLVPVRNSARLSDKIEFFVQHPDQMTRISEINKRRSYDYETTALNERRNAYYNALLKLAHE